MLEAFSYALNEAICRSLTIRESINELQCHDEASHILKDALKAFSLLHA